MFRPILLLLLFIGLIFWCCEDESEPSLNDCGGHDTWITFDTEGGFAYLDSCGVCDDDPSNDCIKDCADEWGGNNICGCTDSTSINYNYQATYNDGSCHSESNDFSQLEQLELEIIDIISIPVCSDDNNCRFIGFGAKPCGGYWEYLVYSIVNVDSTFLSNKVIQYNELNDSLNIQYEILSDCDFVSPPNVHCDNGACVGN